MNLSVCIHILDSGYRIVNTDALLKIFYREFILVGIEQRLVDLTHTYTLTHIYIYNIYAHI